MRCGHWTLSPLRIATDGWWDNLPSIVSSVYYPNCTIWGIILDKNGIPKKNIDVIFRIVSIPEEYRAEAVKTPVSVKSNLDGFFFANIIQEAVVDIIAASVNFRKVLTVPPAESIEVFLC